MTGFFVPIEGIDGCGKTSTAQAVTQALSVRGINAKFVNKKQTEGYFGRYLPRFMRGLKTALWDAEPSDPVSEVPEDVWLYLHTCWYKMLAIKLIKPLVTDGQIVIMDGWYYKFLARHLVNGNFDFQHSYRVLAELPLGNPVFFLDVLPKVSWSRRESFRASEIGAHGQDISGSSQERYMAYQGAVREQFLKFSHAENWQVLPIGSSGLENVTQIIVDIIVSHRS
ncbi:hypothetical protein KA005_68795 [bacterium]|nr:hypothetical protein [bacterium]